MNWRRFLPIIAILALVAIGALTFARNANDPFFQGKRLSAWIRAFDIWQGPTADAAKTLESSGASTEKLLIRMLQSRDSSLTLKVRELLSKQRWVELNLSDAASLQEQALNICNLLGSRVGETAPMVTALVMDYPRKRVTAKTALHALNTLAMMGTNGVHGLVQALAHPDPSLRVRAAQLLGTLRDSGSAEVIRTLETLSQDPHPEFMQAAATSLELLRSRSALSAQSSDELRPDAVSGETPSSVWNVTRGTRVISSSELYPGCRPEDLFGGRLSSVGTPETGSAIFSDSAPDGFVHFIEWETSSPVTLQSFGLIGAHETAFNGYLRAFRGFRLLARRDGDEQFALLHDECVPVPYGSGYCGSLLVRFRNLQKPVTARSFRVEFIQNGTGTYHGARAIELFGFDAPLSPSLIAAALENQEVAIREGVRATLRAEGIASPETR